MTIGLEAVIDAAAGVLAEQSLSSTLSGMARALGTIVPFTSLAVYEVDAEARLLVPMFAQGRHVEQTLASRPSLDDSISGHAVVSRELVHCEPGHPWLGQYLMPDTPDDEPEALIVAPLLVAGEPVGTLNVWREDEAPTFAESEAMLIRRFATLAALAYANASQRDRLHQQAMTDELTGTWNRRYFYDRLESELADVRRHGVGLGLVLLDVDGFKQINDQHGHQNGDHVLRAFSDVLRQNVRENDVVCRTGGEEFAVIAPHIDLARACELARRLVADVAAAQLGPTRLLTVSAGLAIAPSETDDASALFRLADERLLASKAAGKNRATCPERAQASPSATSAAC